MVKLDRLPLTIWESILPGQTSGWRGWQIGGAHVQSCCLPGPSAGAAGPDAPALALPGDSSRDGRLKRTCRQFSGLWMHILTAVRP